MIAGAGLLGLLLAIAIAAVLATKASDSTTSAYRSISSTTAPESAVGSDTSTSQSADKPPVQANVCAADRQVIETAAAAYQAVEGVPPTSQKELLDHDYLATMSPNFELTAENGSFRITPTGPCS